MPRKPANSNQCWSLSPPLRLLTRADTSNTRSQQLNAQKPRSQQAPTKHKLQKNDVSEISPECKTFARRTVITVAVFLRFSNVNNYISTFVAKNT
jgi:hypothetical protein